MMVKRWEAPELRKVQDDACGRWHTILPALGIGDEFLRNRRGPCPMCGGKDRFTFDNKEGLGTWYCQNCGGGDGIKLVSLVLHYGFTEAAREIAKHISGPAPPKPKEPSQAQKLRSMRETWQGSKPINLADAAGRYLIKRCAVESAPPALRYHPRLGYYEKGQDPTFHPAMLAQVSDQAGRAVNIHRTYLTSTGEKADVPNVKRTMAGELPPGACIRLSGPSAKLGIAEGIETALSCSSMFGIPCWAAISAPGLERWIPPVGVTGLMIFGDADTNFAGQKAAYSLAARLAKEKWPGEIIVRLPTYAPQDFNDLHRIQLDSLR